MPKVRAIVDRETMARHLAAVSRVVRGVVPVQESAVLADLDSAGQEGLVVLVREDQVVPECGLVPTGAAVVPVDFPRALVRAVVAFLAALEVAFLVVPEWDREDAATSFRKTPKWPR